MQGLARLGVRAVIGYLLIKPGMQRGYEGCIFCCKEDLTAFFEIAVDDGDLGGAAGGIAEDIGWLRRDQLWPPSKLSK